MAPAVNHQLNQRHHRPKPSHNGTLAKSQAAAILAKWKQASNRNTFPHNHLRHVDSKAPRHWHGKCKTSFRVKRVAVIDGRIDS